MAGVLIYKRIDKYYSFVVSNDDLYKNLKEYLPKKGNQILWEKEGISIDAINKVRAYKDTLVEKLNKGQKINLEKELDLFFREV